MDIIDPQALNRDPRPLISDERILKHRGNWHVVWETLCDPDSWEDKTDVRIHPDYFWRAQAVQ